MTSELRPAVEVWWKADTAFGAACLGNGDRGDQAAAAVIEADREAVRAEQAAELAKWRDKYNEIGQLALEQVSDLGTKLGRAEVELDAAKADLQGANRELAKYKALAETLAGALEEIIERGYVSSSIEEERPDHDRAAEALRQYKEARDER